MSSRMYFSEGKNTIVLQFSSICLTILYASIYSSLHILSPIHAEQLCHQECSTIGYSNEKVTWNSTALSNNSVVFIRPLCINDHGHTIKRLCFSRSWILKRAPACDRIFRNVLCPTEFLECEEGSGIIKYDKFLNRNIQTKRDDKIHFYNGTNILICDEESRMCEDVNCSLRIQNNKEEGKLLLNETQYFMLLHHQKFHICFCCKKNVHSSQRSLNQESRMVLSFNAKKRKVILMMENPKGLSLSPDYPLTCFTNAGFDPIRIAKTRKIRTRRNTTHLNVYDIKMEKYIGEYWCEAYNLNLKKFFSNIVLAYREKPGHEYGLILNVKNLNQHFDKEHGSIQKSSFQKKIADIIDDHVDVSVRFMKIPELDTNQVDIVIHLTSDELKNISEEFTMIKRQLSQLPSYLFVKDLLSVEYCLPETTENSDGSMVLHWDLSRIWERKIPKQLCYQSDGNPVSRICQGNFITGAFWSPPTGQCSKDMQIPSLTNYIHGSLYENITNDLMNNITSLTQQESLSYLDIYIFSELIKKVENQENKNISIFSIINNISEGKKSSLNKSQIMFNATDSLLLSLDNQYFDKQIEGSLHFAANNILITSILPFKNNISGIYLSGKPNSPLYQMELNYLYRNETINDIDMNIVDELEVAISMPEDFLNSSSVEANDDLQIVFTIFYDDSLFLDDENKAASKVISVTIPGFGTYLEEPITILIRSPYDGNCGFWDFGQELQRKRGEWSSFGGAYQGIFSNNSALHICNFYHLTHFALLIMNEPIGVDEGLEATADLYYESETSFYLTIITNVGGVLSGLGILGIYLTGFMFRQWREKDGTKILLNLSTAILLEIVFLQFSGISDINSHTECVLIGCLLHYTLLSKFCWMLIYAVLQYKRFVKVFGETPKHLILKSICFGWGFAIIPVLLTLISSPDSYSKSTICYVRGSLFYVAVILPVLSVIVPNLIVFIIVMYSVTVRKVESTVESQFSLLQLYLAILLFSVLGLPWLLAILAEFVGDLILKRILIYLFCITGTLQGFILFIFYVVINAETRERWKNFLSRGR